METDLKSLVSQIQSIDGTLKNEANKAVNTLLTIRNWMIGYYIVEYEQKGADRATYGVKILETVAAAINKDGLSFRNLKLFRQFFLAYPQVSQEVIDKISKIGQSVHNGFILKNIDNQIGQTVSAQFTLENNGNQIRQTVSAQFKELVLSEEIVNKLSFSHITLLLPIDNPAKRNFYTTEAIKGTWSVRELKRQITSMLFERSGMSAKPEMLLEKANSKVEKQPTPLSLKTFTRLNS